MLMQPSALLLAPPFLGGGLQVLLPWILSRSLLLSLPHSKCSCVRLVEGKLVRDWDMEEVGVLKDGWYE